MNLYTSLTLRYLKENKKRTIVTIIGIILSTALICGIGTICNSLMDYQFRKTVERNGDFHATVYDVPKKDLGKVTKNAGISKYAYSENLGFGKYDNEKFLLQMKSYDKGAFEGYEISLKEGKLPTNNKEIVLSEDSQLFKDKKIGDTITLNVGKRVTKDGDNLTSRWMDEDEKLINTHKEEYKIVGIINKPGFEFGKEITNAITYLDINRIGDKDKVNVSISANNPKEIYTIASVIAKNLNLKAEGTTNEDTDSYSNNKNSVYYDNLYFNEPLLRLQSSSAYENISGGIDKIIILVTSLVIICTIATVYNAFSISISERKKQFGILNSIGATKSQTRKLVLMEAFLVSVIGIPIGLIAGTFAIDLVFKLIGKFYGSSLVGELGLRVVYSPIVIILSSVIVIITILISAILPARQAAKVSPMEAIKNSSNLEIGKVKDSKIVRALFKVEGVLAYKNLRRNKKKFRITLFSLIISVVIFISFSGFMNLFINAQKINSSQENYDLQLYSSSKMDEKSLEEIKNTPGVKRMASANYYGIGIYVPEKKMNLKENKDLINESGYFSIEKVNNKTVYDMQNCLIKFPGDFDISKIKLKEGSFNKKEAIKENGVILVRKSYYEQPGKKYELELTNYKVGDTVKAYTTEYDGEKEIKKEIDLKIMGITDDIPIGNDQYSYMGLDFITYDEVGKQFGVDRGTTNLYISTNGNEDVRNLVKDIGNKYDYNVVDKMEEIKSTKDTLMVMQIFVYGFITVISLVSITNIINTISTNINLRKRELSIIKSIGVTPGGFNKMIYLESFLYGVLALIYGIPLGIGLVMIMNVMLGDFIQFGLVLPWNAIIICIIGIFVITFISSYIPMKKINKENIIENIRQESI